MWAFGRWQQEKKAVEPGLDVEPTISPETVKRAVVEEPVPQEVVEIPASRLEDVWVAPVKAPVPQRACHVCGWPIEEWQRSKGADVAAWFGDYEDQPRVHANPADHRPTKQPEKEAI